MAMPLEGVRVLDFTRVLAGPYCTMMLADMGADVVKVEEPSKGDEQRTLVVYRRPEDEDFFYPYNRNKRSVAVNLKSSQGKEIIYGIAARSDVVVENFAPGVVARLGIDYPRLSEINPALVYCSISGFGQTGPYRDRKAYDSIIQALGGVMSVTGFEDGPPLRTGFMVADVTGSMMSAFSIVNALLHRQRTGEGQFIDMAMLDCLVSIWTTAAAEYMATGKVPRRYGNELYHRVPATCYQAGDGRWLQIVANTPRLWERLCQLLEMPEAATNPLMDSMAKRIENREEVHKLITNRLQAKDAAEWEKLLGEGGIPCGQVNNIHDVFTDPHVLSRGMLQTVQHPVSGEVKQIGLPYKLTKTPGSIRLHPPLLGEHTEAVLRDLLGYDSERIETLERDGVIKRARLS